MTEDKIDIVKDRISFVKALTKTKSNFQGNELTRRNERTQEPTHPYKHFSALRFYLLLTCFDILGHSDEFIDFASWLDSKDEKHLKEKNEIFQNCKNENALLYVSSVNKQYNQIYGASKSFNRFINDILSSENQNKLYESIRITKQSKKTPPNLKDADYVPNINKKRNFLYLIRNSFTHKGILISSFGGGIFPEVDDFNEDCNSYFHQIYSEDKKDFIYIYCVSNWPKVLIEIIEDTIKTSR